MSELMQRFKLTIAYDGSSFHGWQRQEPPDGEPLRTVQGELENALRRLLGQPILTCGASRTDAGVHARGQVAHFDAVSPIPIDRLKPAITSRLPEDIDIIKAELVDEKFDAIRDVLSKEYCYRLHTSGQRPLTQRHCVYHCWTPLDENIMQIAAKRLVGKHDFAGLAAAAHGRTTTVRTIHDCRVERVNIDEIKIYVSGDGFLYNMVRIIAGTLVEVGRGRRTPNVIDEMIATGNRRLGGPTLPGTGLRLEWIQHQTHNQQP